MNVTTDHMEALREQDRIRDNTADHVRRKIDAGTEQAIAGAVAAGPEAIAARLRDLGREWNADRAVMANFAILGGLSYVLGRRNRGWRTFFHVQLGFLLYHSIFGWCPPLPVFRRLGFRSQQEIDAERARLLLALEEAPGR
jgi:hypothetical protein